MCKPFKLLVRKIHALWQDPAFIPRSGCPIMHHTSTQWLMKLVKRASIPTVHRFGMLLLHEKAVQSVSEKLYLFHVMIGRIRHSLEWSKFQMILQNAQCKLFQRM